MNLTQFYNSESSLATAAMKTLPRKNLTAAEVPLMSLVHLRFNDMFVSSSSPSSPSPDKKPSPDQSIFTMLAIAAAKAQAKITRGNSCLSSSPLLSLNITEFNPDSEASSVRCPYHSDDEPEEKQELVPEQHQKRVRSIVGFIPLLGGKHQNRQPRWTPPSSKSKSIPPSSPQPRVGTGGTKSPSSPSFPSPSKSTTTTTTVTNLVVPSVEEDEEEGDDHDDEDELISNISSRKRLLVRADDVVPSQEELMNHWNDTIGKSFLRNSASAVPMHPEVWVLIPFDTLVQRFLFAFRKKEGDGPFAGSVFEQDFALLVLKASPSIRQRIVSHLIGQMRELPASAVAISCRIAVNVVSPSVVSGFVGQGKSCSSFPKVVQDLEIEHEYCTVRRWLEGCSLEISGTCESGEVFWIYGSPHPNFGILSLKELMVSKQQQEQQEKQQQQQREQGNSVPEIKKEGEHNNNDNNGEESLQEAADEEEYQGDENADERTRFSRPKKTKNLSPKKAAATASIARSRRPRIDCQSQQHQKCKTEQENNQDGEERAPPPPPAPLPPSTLHHFKKEATPDHVRAGDDLPPFVHIINPLLFPTCAHDSSLSSAISNCAHCQDELLDRLSFKHAAIDLARIAIPTLLTSYGLNCRWIDDVNFGGGRYFHSLLQQSSNKKNSSLDSNDETSRRRSKILVVASALRALKQAFAFSCELSLVTVKKSDDDDDDEDKKDDDEELDTTASGFATFSVEMPAQNERRHEILTLNCCSYKKRRHQKVWLAEFAPQSGQSPTCSVVVEPHQLLVNVDEKNFIMTIFLPPAKPNKNADGGVIACRVLDIAG